MRADRADIARPRDLDGKTYAGFGAASRCRRCRRSSGTRRHGRLQHRPLGTSAYEALYAGQADFTEPFVAWEGIEAQLRGQPLKTFDYTDYGFPDAYNVLLIGNGPGCRRIPTQARRSCRPLQRGYQLAADDPAQGASC